MRSTSTPPTSRSPSARSRSRRLGCAKNCKKNPAVRRWVPSRGARRCLQYPSHILISGPDAIDATATSTDLAAIP
jgi:hypothetical protein